MNSSITIIETKFECTNKVMKPSFVAIVEEGKTPNVSIKCSFCHLKQELQISIFDKRPMIKHRMGKIKAIKMPQSSMLWLSTRIVNHHPNATVYPQEFQ